MPGVIAFGAGLSSAADADAAGGEASDAAAAALARNAGADGSVEGACDVAFVALTRDHALRAEHVVERVMRRLGPRVVLGISAEGVVAGATEQLQGPGVSVLAARLPGVTLTSFTDADLTMDPSADAVRQRERAVGASPELRATIVLADPYSVPVGALLPILNSAVSSGGEDGRRPVLVGGVASSGHAPGQNVIIGPNAVRRHGLVGLSLSGAIEASALVSQGCRPVGPNLVITKARRSIIMELGGRPALEAIRGVARALDDRTREQLSRGVLLGLVVNEYKERFGRGDFVIRNVVRADEQSGAIVINDLARVGQTARIHVRDADTASEDLALLLDAQKLHDAPAGVFLITCNGRGTRLFDRPDHDAGAIQHAFAAPAPAEQRAKSGAPIDASRALIPLAGFFAAGEIGPIGPASYLHGHTACALIVRPR